MGKSQSRYGFAEPGPLSRPLALKTVLPRPFLESHISGKFNPELAYNPVFRQQRRAASQGVFTRGGDAFLTGGPLGSGMDVQTMVMSSN